MQLIKFILSNKIDMIYDEYISRADELDICSGFSLDPQYQDYQDDFFESSEYNMLCECEEYVNYADLLFDKINKFNYSDDSIDLIIKEVNDCNNEKYIIQLIGIIIENNASTLHDIFRKCDKLLKIRNKYFC